MFHVVLVEPEIPPNTGNAIRLCANTGFTLHLVKPLGFSMDRKSVRRSGLDYRDLADVKIHADLDACFQALGEARLFTIETTGSHLYSEARFEAGDAVLFGSERRGLPVRVLDHVPRERQLVVPMRPNNRSLNLSNTVALVMYEAWGQHGYAGSAPITRTDS
jgi:tRNA (cytidine/uridine-2'-O-)-methyltransferase